MRTSLLVVAMVLLVAPAFGQPYAPEYLEQLPSYVAPPLAAPAAPEVEAAPPPVDATQQKVTEIGEFMAADEAAAREEGTRRDTAATDHALTTGDYLRVFAWLCVIIAAILLLGAAVRRWGKKTPLLAGADLGKIMGRLYLDRNVSLHFVETAGHVLVVGVTQNAITLLASFDQALFAKTRAAASPESNHNLAPSEFLRHLESSTTRMRAESEESAPDAEIQALQNDIARLQRYLKEEAREFRE